MSPPATAGGTDKSASLFFPAAINYNPIRKENEGAPEILCFD